MQQKKHPFLQGLLPLDSSRIPLDLIAGTTLAALGIPEVMGYTNIAGMPVVTGLYTIVLPSWRSRCSVRHATSWWAPTPRPPRSSQPDSPAWRQPRRINTWRSPGCSH